VLNPSKTLSSTLPKPFSSCSRWNRPRQRINETGRCRLAEKGHRGAESRRGPAKAVRVVDALPGAVPPAVNLEKVWNRDDSVFDGFNSRDFLFCATGAAAAVGGLATLWPFVPK